MSKSALLITALICGLGLAAGCQSTKSPEAANTLAISEPITAEEEDGQMVAVSDPDYDPDEIICKTKTSTESRLRKTKDCRTAEQWRQSQTNATRAINSLKDNVTRANSQ